MFRCQVCEQIAPAGTKAEKIAIARRSKTYAVRSRPITRRRGRRGSTARKIIDKGGEGHEIVQEVVACEDCATEYKARREAAELAAREAAMQADTEEAEPVIAASDTANG